MMLPVDRWMEHNAGFLIALVIYVYALYFVYRYFKLPRMLMQRQWGKVAFLMLVLIAVTVGMTYFPSSSGYVLRGRGMRTQTIWFFFLVVTGFSLAIELTFELFRQILQRQAIEAEKTRPSWRSIRRRLIRISCLIRSIRFMPWCCRGRTRRSRPLSSFPGYCATCIRRASRN